MPSITDMISGDYVKLKDGRLEKIVTIWGVNSDGTLEPPSRGGFGVITESGRRVSMWEVWAYVKTKEKYTADHPDLDYDKLRAACNYALLQLDIADLKEADSAPMSAEEHRSMAYRKLRDAMNEEK